MPDILQIDGDTVLIDTEQIGFGGTSSSPRITQAVSISVQGPEPPPIRITQAVSLSVQGPPFIPSRITQGVLISVVMNERRQIQLGQPIKLNCWQPCAVYGTYNPILYLGANAND